MEKGSHRILHLCLDKRQIWQFPHAKIFIFWQKDQAALLSCDTLNRIKRGFAGEEIVNFDAFWSRFSHRLDQLPILIKRHQLLGSWDNGEAAILSLSKPASDAEIEQVETEIGELLPAQLRQLFGEGAKSCHVRWNWPGQFHISEGGYCDRIDYVNRPDIESFPGHGSLDWDLSNIPQIYADWQEWLAYIAIDENPPENDEDDALFRLMQVDFAGRAFPFHNATNGDPIGIDRGPSGQMVLLNHESDGEIGWYLGHDLFGWLDALSAMAFLQPDVGQISLFSDGRLDQAYRSDQSLPDWYPEEGRPNAAILDLQHPDAKAWMAAFWGDSQI